MQGLEQFSVDEMEDSSLLDCYRIALDFGMPAALRAYEKIALENKHTHDDSNDDDYDDK